VGLTIVRAHRGTEGYRKSVRVPARHQPGRMRIGWVAHVNQDRLRRRPWTQLDVQARICPWTAQRLNILPAQHTNTGDHLAWDYGTAHPKTAGGDLDNGRGDPHHEHDKKGTGYKHHKAKRSPKSQSVGPRQEGNEADEKQPDPPLRPEAFPLYEHARSIARGGYSRVSWPRQRRT